ncbi:MAG: hypothetical protein AABX10_02880 [Nanoarchaeota archaeon]
MMIEYVLLGTTALFAIVLIVLLVLSGKKGNKKQRKVMSKEMRKIKDQISENSE